MVAPAPFAFHDMQGVLLGPFSDIILAYDVATVLRQQIYPRKHFAPGHGNSWRVGGALEHETLDTLDTGILRVLTSDARAGVTSIAETVSATPIMVRNRRSIWCELVLQRTPKQATIS